MSGRASRSGLEQITLAEAALQATSIGWAVFPLLPRDKRPYGGTGGVHDATTDKTKVRHWWTETPEANIGMACGEASGVFVLDVDPRHGGDESLAALEAKHGLLPTTVKAATGGGGRHLLFQHPGGKLGNSAGKVGNGLDVRGDGGYIVMPPSVHPTGTLYEWVNHPDGTTLISAPDWLLGKLDVEDVTERTDSISVLSALSVTGVRSIEQAINLTLPTRAGERHYRAFDLARAIKTMKPDAEPKTFRKQVKLWHDMGGHSGTHGWEDSYNAFLEAWPKVKHLAGAGPLAKAIKRLNAMNDEQLPALATDYGDDTRRLLKVCIALQCEADDDVFYLSARAAAELAEFRDQMTAWRRLRVLVADGLLEVVEPGTKTKATRYHYTGAHHREQHATTPVRCDDPGGQARPQAHAKAQGRGSRHSRLAGPGLP